MGATGIPAAPAVLAGRAPGRPLGVLCSLQLGARDARLATGRDARLATGRELPTERSVAL
ncbi:MAG: hypothetical protein M1522_07760 [Actinobacteria bacterium]|nr:hypothetical protein [Actinomycetota bacterium]